MLWALRRTLETIGLRVLPNSRSYQNANLETLKPPLQRVETIDLAGVTEADSLLAFGDYLLLGEGGPVIRYHLFNRDSGLIEWTEEMSGKGTPLDYQPAYANDVVLLGGAATTTVRAVRVSTGEALWEGTGAGTTTGRFPILTDHLALYHDQSQLVATNATSGAVFWKFSTTTATAPVSLFGNQAYLLDEAGVLRALDLRTGEQLWSRPNVGSDASNFIATERYVFYSNQDLGTFGALSAEDGSLDWERAASTFAKSPAIALAYDRLYAFISDDDYGEG